MGNAVPSLLAEVLSIQREGGLQRAAAFVERYANWNPELHGVVAANIRDAIEYRYYLVRYAVIDAPVH